LEVTTKLNGIYIFKMAEKTIWIKKMSIFTT